MQSNIFSSADDNEINKINYFIFLTKTVLKLLNVPNTIQKKKIKSMYYIYYINVYIINNEINY